MRRDPRATSSSVPGSGTLAPRGRRSSSPRRRAARRRPAGRSRRASRSARSRRDRRPRRERLEQHVEAEGRAVRERRRRDRASRCAHRRRAADGGRPVVYLDAARPSKTAVGGVEADVGREGKSAALVTSLPTRRVKRHLREAADRCPASTLPSTSGGTRSARPARAEIAGDREGVAPQRRGTACCARARAWTAAWFEPNGVDDGRAALAVREPYDAVGYASVSDSVRVRASRFVAGRELRRRGRVPNGAARAACGDATMPGPQAANSQIRIRMNRSAPQPQRFATRSHWDG